MALLRAETRLSVQTAVDVDASRVPGAEFCLQSEIGRVSFGVLLWEIFTLGKAPYRDDMPRDQFRTRLDERIGPAKKATPEINQVMGQCWETEPRSRPSFQRLEKRLRRILDGTSDSSSSQSSGRGTTSQSSSNQLDSISSVTGSATNLIQPDPLPLPMENFEHNPEENELPTQRANRHWINRLFGTTRRLWLGVGLTVSLVLILVTGISLGISFSGKGSSEETSMNTTTTATEPTSAKTPTTTDSSKPTTSSTATGSTQKSSKTTTSSTTTGSTQKSSKTTPSSRSTTVGPTNRTDDLIVNSGGFGMGVATDIIEFYYPWNHKKGGVVEQRLASKKWAHCSVWLNGTNTILIAGGSDQLSLSGFRSAEFLHVVGPETASLSRAPTMNKPRAFSAIAEIEGVVYICGGGLRWPPATTNTCEKLRKGGTAWEEAPSMKTKRMALALVAVGKALYAMGGADEKATLLSSMERLVVGSTEWEPMEWMKNGRAGFGAAAIGKFIYACGADVAKPLALRTKPLKSCERYDTEKGKWEDIHDMVVARGHFAMVALHGDLFAIGGAFDEPGAKSIEMYDPTTDRWTKPQQQIKGFSDYISAAAIPKSK